MRICEDLTEDLNKDLWGSFKFLQRSSRILLRSLKDPYKFLRILKDPCKDPHKDILLGSFADEESLRIIQRSCEDPLKIFIFKDLWQVFEDLQRSLKILWGFSPGIFTDVGTCIHRSIHTRTVIVKLYLLFFVPVASRAHVTTIG